MTVKGRVTKIIPFSDVDGPGNRTSVFLSGCPFRCWFCHNPETIHVCNNCGLCVAQCPQKALSWQEGKVIWDPSRCVSCDTCIHGCPNLSTPRIRWMSAAEVMDEIAPYIPYIRGISVSGGECMMQPDFLLALFRLAKEQGLTCLIDSDGAYDFRNYPDLLAVSDGVMLDVKAYDDSFHTWLCGVSNQTVLANLHYLLSVNKLEEVRTVILPRFPEQNETTVRSVSQIIQDKTIYKLLRYRPFGVRPEGLEKMGKGQASLEEGQRLLNIAKQLGASQTVLI